jgi:hypothetical protein
MRSGSAALFIDLKMSELSLNYFLKVPLRCNTVAGGGDFETAAEHDKCIEGPECASDAAGKRPPLLQRPLARKGSAPASGFEGRDEFKEAMQTPVALLRKPHDYQWAIKPISQGHMWISPCQQHSYPIPTLFHRTFSCVCCPCSLPSRCLFLNGFC